MEERIEEEMKERAKQSKVLAQALKDGKTGREKIEVMGALIDYLNELQLNLVSWCNGRMYIHDLFRRIICN